MKQYTFDGKHDDGIESYPVSSCFTTTTTVDDDVDDGSLDQ